METLERVVAQLDKPVIKRLIGSGDVIYMVFTFEDGTKIYTGEEDHDVLVHPNGKKEIVYSGNKYVDVIDDRESDYPIEEVMTREEEKDAIMIYEEWTEGEAESVMEKTVNKPNKLEVVTIFLIPEQGAGYVIFSDNIKIFFEEGYGRNVKIDTKGDITEVGFDDPYVEILSEVEIDDPRIQTMWPSQLDAWNTIMGKDIEWKDEWDALLEEL